MKRAELLFQFSHSSTQIARLSAILLHPTVCPAKVSARPNATIHTTGIDAAVGVAIHLVKQLHVPLAQLSALSHQWSVCLHEKRIIFIFFIEFKSNPIKNFKAAKFTHFYCCFWHWYIVKLTLELVIAQHKE